MFVVPYHKWANKNHPNMSEPGIDILAFKLGQSPEQDTMYATEAKWRKDTVGLLDAIRRKKVGVISTLTELTDVRLCDEINLLLKRIEQNRELHDRIFDFYRRFVDAPKGIYNATFFLVDTNVDINRCIETLTPISRNPRNLKSFNHFVDNLEIITEEIFRGTKDWPMKQE